MTATSAYRASIPDIPAKPTRVVLIGGSGHVGRLLAGHFHGQGIGVVVVTRTTFCSPWRVVAWDGTHSGPWVRALEGADVVINLAGRSVDCRYHRANRREILDSRVRSTRLLAQAIEGLVTPPGLWLNASTATIYRHSLDREMDEETGELGSCEEDAPRSWRFSTDVAKRWEETFFSANTPQTRKIALRSAMIMSPDLGGVFSQLLRLVRLGLGGQAASGRQYVSWVHERDFVRAVDFLIDGKQIEGAVNVASPHPIPNREFMRGLREAWGIGFGLPATQRMLELGAFFLRTETELILKSRRV
ncbi:MAG TPA: NAD-dependent epimerase/dehydratase family protein, partial [Candidatus Acidoferrum sp.]|nr:NAD-dependent epimerase/dehydratase family protein [Candidatus Acidoferrum sp.]